MLNAFLLNLMTWWIKKYKTKWGCQAQRMMNSSLTCLFILFLQCHASMTFAYSICSFNRSFKLFLSVWCWHWRWWAYSQTALQFSRWLFYCIFHLFWSNLFFCHNIFFFFETKTRLFIDIMKETPSTWGETK